MDDERIVDLFFSRSEDALRESEEKYGAYCRSIAYRILRSDADAEECVNDTLYRAWRSIPPAKPACLRHYLGALVRNLSINRLDKRTARRRRPEGQSAPASWNDATVPDGSDPEGDLALREGINAFLTTLGKEARIVFLQKYWYCCRIDEIAENTGLSVSNVKVILHRTRKLFSDYLKKEGYLS